MYTVCLFSLVINAVLIVDVQQFVFDPADLLGRLLSSLVMQTVFLIKLSQAHHGLFTHTPLQKEGVVNILKKEMIKLGYENHRKGDNLVFVTNKILTRCTLMWICCDFRMRMTRTDLKDKLLHFM